MKNTSTDKTAAEQFGEDMIAGVNYASDLAKLTDKLAHVSTANARLVYQLRERDAKEAAKAKKQRKYRFYISYVSLLAGAVSAVLGSTHVLPVTAAVAVGCSCVSLFLCCLAFEFLANKE